MLDLPFCPLIGNYIRKCGWRIGALLRHKIKAEVEVYC